MANSYKVLLDENASKCLSKLDKPQRVLILGWIRKNLEGCENPYAVSSAKSLAGIPGGVRYRVGNYRILCSIDNNQVVIRIFKIGHRSKVYRSL